MADDRPRFLPPTADPPRFVAAGPPASAWPTGAPRGAPRGGAGGATGDVEARGGPPDGEAAGGDGAPSSNGLAVASLVLSVLGLGLLIVSFGLLCFVSLPCSALGWRFGRRARERDGEQALAQGGLLTGVLGTVLSAAALLVWVALVATA